jgi:hypothetical protein
MDLLLCAESRRAEYRQMQKTAVRISAQWGGFEPESNVQKRHRPPGLPAACGFSAESA